MQANLSTSGRRHRASVNRSITLSECAYDALHLFVSTDKRECAACDTERTAAGQNEPQFVRTFGVP
eukprot:6198596-Pleurochrysis_carterae.AAC.1